MDNTNKNLKAPNIKISINKKGENLLIVQNLTFSYNQREDRILYIINHENIQERIDFFVTRRMLLKLLDAFDDILINHCDNGKLFKELYLNQEELVSSKSISEKQNSNKVINKDKNWEKSVNSNDLDFTKTKEPIILDSLSYSVDKNSNITLKFLSRNKIYAISTMDKIMFQRTLSSMMRVIPFVAWGISPYILD